MQRSVVYGSCRSAHTRANKLGVQINTINMSDTVKFTVTEILTEYRVSSA